jgi:hypothetical protein
MRSAQPCPGRANTDEQKTQLMDRLLDAWKKQPKLRLGQLLVCAAHPPDSDIFNDEDYPLLESVEKFVAEYNRPNTRGRGSRKARYEESEHDVDQVPAVAGEEDRPVA